MKSPEIQTVVKTETITITELVPVTKTIEVARPHNCQSIPEPDRERLETAGGSIAYLMAVKAYYEACLESL
jgi:hypothetical protein